MITPNRENKMVYIEDIGRLKIRVMAFIGISKKVLEQKRDFLWSSFVMKDGECRRVSLATSKKNFKAQWIDRYQKALDCLNSKDFTTADWIDLRDVLYMVLYTIDMQGEKSMKALRESNKDIVIEVFKKDDTLFNDALIQFQGIM